MLPQISTQHSRGSQEWMEAIGHIGMLERRSGLQHLQAYCLVQVSHSLSQCTAKERRTSDENQGGEDVQWRREHANVGIRSENRNLYRRTELQLEEELEIKCKERKQGLRLRKGVVASGLGHSSQISRANGHQAINL